MQRGAGVLCHISSLPSKYGIGSLGREAMEFAKILKKSGFSYWQILPIGQTDFGDSPYQSLFSASGNPYFIDLEALKREGLLTGKELKGEISKDRRIDYGALYQRRYPLLRTAFSRFNIENKEFLAFEREGSFEDYALFMAAKSVYGCDFSSWDEKFRLRDEGAIKFFKEKHHEEMLFWLFLQFKFFEQWKKFKAYCNGLGLKLIGDIPLYVSYFSADVWAHPNLFSLGEDLSLREVAGVPPDYFSKSGQKWGSPVYLWENHERDGFSWWKGRLARALSLFDFVRIDHFRGLSRYFCVKADGEPKDGIWRTGPGDKLFGISGRERIIAEDLGVSDDALKELLSKTGFPGMKVLLFAFDGAEDNPHLPHTYPKNCVAYTGTHDNDTLVGYLKSLSSEAFILFRSHVAAELERLKMKVKLSSTPKSIARALKEALLFSNADVAILPMQDILEEDNSCRMNTPGTREGNWRYRLNRVPSAKVFRRLKNRIKKYRR